MNIKNTFIALGAIAAFCAAIATTLNYFVPDKSAQFSGELKEHQESLRSLVDLIYKNNKEEFNIYRNSNMKMPEKKFNIIVNTALEDNLYQNRADSLIDFLDKVATCEFDYLCRVSDSENTYDGLMYNTWYWLRPYIEKSRAVYPKTFGSMLQKRAKEAKTRINGQ